MGSWAKKAISRVSGSASRERKCHRSPEDFPSPRPEREREEEEFAVPLGLPPSEGLDEGSLEDMVTVVSSGIVEGCHDVVVLRGGMSISSSSS